MLNDTLFRVPTLSDLRRGVERLFESIPAYDVVTGARPFPSLNVWEDGETLVAEAEVPGLTMKDIDVTVVGDELTIKGQRTPQDGAKPVYHRQERGTGAFSRTMTLPYEINADAVEATLRDGILTIRLPKSETARARKIAVKAL
jgi:HSP20 family protein